MADADSERQVNYTRYRLAELKSQRAGLDGLIAYEENVLAKLLESMVE